MGKLTTHILDTAHGCPAGNVDVRLYALGSGRELRTSATTNADGRTHAALLEGEAMQTGTYELEFDIGAYFEARGTEMDSPAFLDTIVLRFSIRTGGDYHVPLLASPWSYSTYRGS